jgi:hypothetical protein
MPSLTPEVLVALGAGALAVVVAVVLLARRSRRRRTVPAAAETPVAERAAATWHEPSPPDPAAGSGRTVADAVSRALAARESRSGDARDRLLAVLLHDPVRAVGATVELEACRRQLERLTGALEHERGTLRGVLERLAATGLSEAQLARLSGLGQAEVRALLARDAVQPRG